MTQVNSELVTSGRKKRRVLLQQLLYYGVVFLSVAIALGTNFLLRPYLEQTPTPPFFAAVMVSAWYGGLVPGLLATVLSTLVINYFLLEPVYSSNISHLGTLVRLGVFVMAAMLINSLNAAQRTAHRKAEANYEFLRESEARFGRLVESNIIGIIVADLNGAILEANDVFLEMVGYTREELRSGRMRWREMTTPESLEVSDKAVQELLTTGTCTPFEKEYFRKDGSRLPILHGAVMTTETTVIGFVLDLSDRQQAASRERSLNTQVQSAKEQLETVLASINDQFLVLDHQWRYIYVNDRVAEVTGKSKEYLLGKSIWDVFPEIVGSKFYEQLHHAVSEQKIIHFEFFYSPWQRWFENHIYPCATGVSVLVTEITNRKRDQEKLQRTNQTLQTLIECCPVAIAFFDHQGIVKLWNRAAERIYGWSAEEAIGRFMPGVPHRTEEFLASLQMVLNGRSLNGMEVQHQTKDGRMVDLEVWANLTHDVAGNPGCLGIAWDITERKRTEQALRTSEERYRSLIATTTAVVWTTDANGAFILSQPSWEKYTGQSWAEYAGLGWLEMVHPQDREELAAQWQHTLLEKSLYETETRLWHAPSGQYRHVIARAVPLFNPDGSVREWIGMDTDIHDRKQAEAEREQLLSREQAARKQAEAANRIKDEFLAVLSHELRTPLNPILGWVKLLRNSKLDAQKTTYALETIERNARLQTQLIGDLLDVSRILQGKLSLNIASVDLATTITAAIETLRLAAQAKSIQIETIFNSTKVQVAGDTARLQQIIWNLLSNAVKFTDAGGRVEVRLERVGTQAQITVSDTGRGINPEFLPYVFDYFRQADSATTRKFGGLGLGLAIVRHLVELHGGTVTAHSLGEGYGATFTVSIPLIKAVLFAQELNNDFSSVTSTVSSLTDIKILMVDDDADSRNYISFLLEQAGAEVILAASAQEALQILWQSTPKILLSDIGMPQMDGYMLIQQIRKLPPEWGGNIKAIALTAYAGEMNEQQAKKAGFQYHISKPIEPEELIKTIIELVNK